MERPETLLKGEERYGAISDARAVCRLGRFLLDALGLNPATNFFESSNAKRLFGSLSYSRASKWVENLAVCLSFALRLCSFLQLGAAALEEERARKRGVKTDDGSDDCCRKFPGVAEPKNGRSEPAPLAAPNPRSARD